MQLSVLDDGFAIDGKHFPCTVVKPVQIKELLVLWAEEIRVLEEGESAYMPLRMDRVDVFPSLCCLKATRQGEQVCLYVQEAVDPLYDPKDADQEDYWLWVFSDEAAMQLSPIWIDASRIAQYDRQEWGNTLLRACQELGGDS